MKKKVAGVYIYMVAFILIITRYFVYGYIHGY